VGGACCVYGERRRAYWGLIGVSEGKRPLGRLRHRWKDNIKIIDGSVGSRMGGMDWIDLMEGGDRWWALVNTVMNLEVP